MGLSILFFGTPGFCCPVLASLQQGGRLPKAIVCQPDRPQGRGQSIQAPPVKAWAQEHQVAILQPTKGSDPSFLAQVSELQPDLGVVFAFGQLLPKALLQIPRLGFINLHPSLLPRYRGAAPIQWALIRGDQKTGVSILTVTPRLDDGDIIVQETLEIQENETAPELGERLACLGAKLLLQAIEQLEHGAATFTKQSEEGVLWAPVLKKEDGRIDWSRSALAIHNQIRGVQPWPGAFTRLHGKLLKVHRAQVADKASSVSKTLPGEVLRASGKELWVKTGEGALAILELQQEGKRCMSVSEFLPGKSIQEGFRLGGGASWPAG